MADVKISGLPASTTPLAGTEVLPIVQGGQTRQVSVANVTAGRNVAALSVTATTVNGTTFDTNVAAAGVTLAGTTLAADGTNANIDISIVPKGTGQVVINAGTASLPAIAPTGDPNTGIFFPAADTIAFTEGGVESVRINSSSNVGIGTTSPAARLEVRGPDNTALNSKGNLFVADGGTAAQAANEGGQISFGAWLTGDLTAPYPMAAIKGITESSTTNINNGALIFGTSTSTTVTEKVRITSAGVVDLAQGQIKFPATQVASADANTLDDYEEGTWTGTISDGTNNATMSINTGFYTKIGNIVTVTGYFVVSDKGSISGALRLTGLPFNVANNNAAYSSTTFGFAVGANITAGQAIAGYTQIAAAYINLMLWDATTGPSSLLASEINSNFGIIVNISYRV
jgi:hypothetical protein